MRSAKVVRVPLSRVHRSCESSVVLLGQVGEGRPRVQEGVRELREFDSYESCLGILSRVGLRELREL